MALKLNSANDRPLANDFCERSTHLQNDNTNQLVFLACNANNLHYFYADPVITLVSGNTHLYGISTLPILPNELPNLTNAISATKMKNVE